MDFDFALLLVVLVLVCGAISLLDWLVLSKRRQALVPASSTTGAGPESGMDAQPEPVPEPAWIEYPKSFFPVLLLVLLLRSFLVEPFKIPSGSMLPTLRVGDYILVNKFTYGLRLPVLGTKIWALNDPQRGDILVFKYPDKPNVNYIKRVVGLPGDKIVYSNKKVTLNGDVLNYDVAAETFDKLLLKETVGGITHDIQVDHARFGPVGEWEVPEGHYFVLGDNRDNSLDSRVWGFVPEANLVGKAFAIWMHMPGYVPSFSRNGGIE